MGTVSVSLPSDGSAASVSQYNTPITTIVNAINGNLDSTNISSLSGTDITAGTLPGTAFDTTTKGGWIGDTNTYTYSANNGNKEFVLNATSDPTSYLSPGMKFKVARSTTPPTQCMAFVSGSSQYATKASPSGISFTSAFTCEAWVYLQSYNGGIQGIVSRYNGTNGFGLQVLGTGQLQLFAYGTGTFQNSYASVPINQWVHLAGTYSAGTMVLYMNGTVMPSLLTGSSTSITQAGPLQVGAVNSANYFNGYISEARIWSVAQSAANIQANMAINLTGSETNLVALFKGNGNFNDATSNANNLTATNSAIATQAANPYNVTEYGIITAVTSSTVTLFTGNSNTIPNQTLNTPQYSTSASPFGLPVNLKKYKQTVLLCANSTSSSTTAAQLNGASITITIPTGSPRVKVQLITGQSVYNNTSGDGTQTSLWLGTVPSGTQLANRVSSSGGVNYQLGGDVYTEITPIAGSNTFNAGLASQGGGTSTIAGSATTPIIFSVEVDL